jgi:hypothetical protein
VVGEFGSRGLTEDGLSIVLLDVPDGGRSGSYRGAVSYYPASVVKTFYLAYYETRKESGALKDSPELVRAVKDMPSPDLSAAVSAESFCGVAVPCALT